MSTYKPHTPMPLDMLEYQQKIKEFSGLHMSFPYGTLLPKEAGKVFSTLVPTEMQFVGMTIRGFFYIPEASDTKSEFYLIYHKTGTHTSDSVADVIVRQTSVSSYALRFDWVNPATKTRTDPVAVPGYYSVGVRFQTDQNLSMLFREDEFHVIDQHKVLGFKWYFQMYGRVHFLVSLHFSAETDQSPRQLGQKFYVNYPECGIGSYWLIEGVITGTNKPLTVKLPGGEANFPLRTVKQQDVVTIHIRSTRGGYLVSTSFDDETKFITTADNSKNFIYPEFSDNFQIYRQFAEQGAERYQ